MARECEALDQVASGEVRTLGARGWLLLQGMLAFRVSFMSADSARQVLRQPAELLPQLDPVTDQGAECLSHEAQSG